MTLIDMLKDDAAYSFNEFMKALEGVTEPQAWAVLPPAGEEYLHTDGSIHGLVHHVAGVKWMYGSICFRNTEMRWRDLADQIDAFEPSWEGALDFLARGHAYWMASWEDFTDDRLEEMRPTNWPQEWPARKIIRLMNYHDSYHAGQIPVLRYAVGPSAVKPPSAAADVRQYCADSRHW